MATPSDKNDKNNSNGSYRPRHEIVKSILMAVQNGYDSQMKIMHAAFVTNSAAKIALEELVAKGMLVIVPDGTKRYRITELGRKVLESS